MAVSGADKAAAQRKWSFRNGKTESFKYPYIRSPRGASLLSRACGPDGIDADELFAMVFSGRAVLRTVLKSHVSQINDLLVETDYRIVGVRGQGRWYTLVRREAEEAAYTSGNPEPVPKKPKQNNDHGAVLSANPESASIISGPEAAEAAAGLEQRNRPSKRS